MLAMPAFGQRDLPDPLIQLPPIPKWVAGIECQKENAVSIRTLYRVVDHDMDLKATENQRWAAAVYGQHLGFIEMSVLVKAMENKNSIKVEEQLRKVKNEKVKMYLRFLLSAFCSNVA